MEERMRWIARFLARYTWWGMLWLMRRPVMRRLQTGMPKMFRPASREKVWRSHLRQSAFARRHGLALLTFMYTLLLLSAAFTAIYFAVLDLLDSGMFIKKG